MICMSYNVIKNKIMNSIVKLLIIIQNKWLMGYKIYNKKSNYSISHTLPEHGLLLIYKPSRVLLSSTMIYQTIYRMRCGHLGARHNGCCEHTDWKGQVGLVNSKIFTGEGDS